MDKASDSGSEDCGFDSHRGYLLAFCSREAPGVEECIGVGFLRLRDLLRALEAAFLTRRGEAEALDASMAREAPRGAL